MYCSLECLEDCEGGDNDEEFIQLEGSETLGKEVDIESLPIIIFEDSSGGEGCVREGQDLLCQTVYENCRVVGGRVYRTRAPFLKVPQPLVISPAYLGFVVHAVDPRYLMYRNVGCLFALPPDSSFMPPSIDTILVCRALYPVLRDSMRTQTLSRVLDAGAGSGFIGKFIALNSPGQGPLTVVLADTDRKSADFTRCGWFNAPRFGMGGREIEWERHTGDALDVVNASSFDMVVSNPPYIPTEAEVTSGSEGAEVDDGRRSSVSFWKGTHLLRGLVANGGTLRTHTENGSRVVVALSSITLKSAAVVNSLRLAAANASLTVLGECEVGWKAWYAGPGQSSCGYLMATEGELTEKIEIASCLFYVGATKRSRRGCEQNLRTGLRFHFVYVLSFASNPEPEMSYNRLAS